ncbi:30S ribosomal protein S20 [Buchnera aphidicola (Tetraneura ulmi)]|uniref:30S ribosomal protein S20 n=1 Tax=Buchnera aphidicola TaxID=9 RepID=UPI003463AA82
MANIKSSKRDAIKSRKKRTENIKKRSMIKNIMKKVHLEIINGKKKEAEIVFRKMQSVLDRFATRGIIHKNKAARHKKNFSLKLKKLA